MRKPEKVSSGLNHRCFFTRMENPQGSCRADWLRKPIKVSFQNLLNFQWRTKKAKPESFSMHYSKRQMQHFIQKIRTFLFWLSLLMLLIKFMKSRWWKLRAESVSILAKLKNTSRNWRCNKASSNSCNYRMWRNFSFTWCWEN